MYKWIESKGGGVNNVYVVMSDDGTTATSKKGFEQAEKNLKRKQKAQQTACRLFAMSGGGKSGLF